MIAIWREIRAFEITEQRHCVKSVQIRVFCGLYFPVFGMNTGKYGPEKTLYLDTFHAVIGANEWLTEMELEGIRRKILTPGDAEENQEINNIPVI